MSVGLNATEKSVDGLGQVRGVYRTVGFAMSHTCVGPMPSSTRVRSSGLIESESGV